MPRIIGEGPHETYYHTPDDNWTDIMFIAKYNFIDSVKAFLDTQHVILH